MLINFEEQFIACKKLVNWKIKNVTSQGGAGGGACQSHQMKPGRLEGGGPKIDQKSVTYYLNGF